MYCYAKSLVVRRAYSLGATKLAPLLPSYTDGEARIHTKLTDRLGCTRLQVQDMSGGCGGMYSVTAVSPKFKGLSVLKQHRLVTDALKDEIAALHGIRITTQVE